MYFCMAVLKHLTWVVSIKYVTLEKKMADPELKPDINTSW